MKITTSYKLRIRHYRTVFLDTLDIYRRAVDYLIDVCLKEWNVISSICNAKYQQSYVEHLCHKTKDNLNPPYAEFDTLYEKFPSYLRRSAINDALGLVSSHQSNLARWEASKPKSRGKRPSVPTAGFTFPVLYKGDCYQQLSEYQYRIKAYIRNTWDWVTVDVCRSDADYIKHHCANRKMLSPTLVKHGKRWSLVFAFEESVTLPTKDISEQRILAVDLGINNACTCSVMHSDGAILGRDFYKLPREYDCLSHAIGRIKKAQQHGNYKTPRLWALAKGINSDIAVRTAEHIISTAILYDVDVIVFERLDIRGKKRGSKKQKLHHWRAGYVQRMVTIKAHRNGMRISHICAWGTSRLAFDGSGKVFRGKDSPKTNGNYSLCEFTSGKVYHCDLNASYNIGSRYFVREIIKSVPESERLRLQAKVPAACKRSTCTLSTLLSLCAELAA